MGWWTGVSVGGAGADRGRVRVSRSAAAVVVCVLAGLAVAACALPPPPGRAPLRYRDAISAETVLTAGVVYGHATDRDGKDVALLADVRRPAGATGTDRPVVIWAHAGGFADGTRTADDVRALSERFARRGYLTLSVDYRLDADPGCTGATFVRCRPAVVDAKHDLQAAVRWVRAHAAELGADPDRIALAGTSAGAVASIWAAATPEDAGLSGTPEESSAVQAVVSISGGLPDIGILGAGDPPMLFLHGSEDTTVPFAWAKANVATLTDAGVPALLEALDGAGHVPYDGDRRTFDRFDDQAVAFLYGALGLGPDEALERAALRPS